MRFAGLKATANPLQPVQTLNVSILIFGGDFGGDLLEYKGN